MDETQQHRDEPTGIHRPVNSHTASVEGREDEASNDRPGRIIKHFDFPQLLARSELSLVESSLSHSGEKAYELIANESLSKRTFIKT